MVVFPFSASAPALPGGGNRRAWARRTVAAASLSSQSDRVIAIAAQLDRLADAELMHGHPGAAELLAHRAAAMREAAQ